MSEQTGRDAAVEALVSRFRADRETSNWAPAALACVSVDPGGWTRAGRALTFGEVVDVLAEAGLLRVPAGAGFEAPAAALRQLADACDAGEIYEFTATRELSPIEINGQVVVPPHPVTRLRIEIHHKPEPETPVREGHQP